MRRIRERIPAPYLTGRTWFAGLEFACDARALVPRSPIAEWIERGFEPWLEPEHRRAGAGDRHGRRRHRRRLRNGVPERDRRRGRHLRNDALALARENCIAHGVVGRVRLSSSDVYDAVGDRYDLIVSNPPYVDAATMATLDPEYLHEPRAGLEAGVDGLDCVRRILAGASAHLRPGGVLVCEVGETRTALERAFPVVPFTWLELSRGGEGVFLSPREQLAEIASPRTVGRVIFPG